MKIIKIYRTDFGSIYSVFFRIEGGDTFVYYPEGNELFNCHYEEFYLGGPDEDPDEKRIQFHQGEPVDSFRLRHMLMNYFLLTVAKREERSNTILTAA